MFPRMRLFLHPQTWCCIKSTQVWNLEVPWAAPKAQQSWGWEARDGHPRQQCLSCWPCSHSAPRAVKLISSPGTPVCSPANSLFVRACFCGEGRVSPSMSRFTDVFFRASWKLWIKGRKSCWRARWELGKNVFGPHVLSWVWPNWFLELHLSKMLHLFESNKTFTDVSSCAVKQHEFAWIS